MTPVVRIGAPSRSVVPDAELLAAIRSAFGADRVVHVEREVSRYSTSATVEDVRVRLADGEQVPLLLKDLTPAALLPGARAGKPSGITDSGREITAYRDLLPALPGSATATCHAVVDDGQRRWLLLEKVPGVELYQVGELEIWAAAAAALARLHRDLTAALESRPSAAAALLQHDARGLRRWMQRALTFEQRRGGARTDALRSLAAAHEEAVAALTALPRVVCHGDLYASNVLVVRGERLRVCPVDWELVSLGPGVLDLAALTSGGWSDAERDVMAKAYWSSMDDGRWRPSLDELRRSLDLARLQVCVQWLGWSPDWTPPSEHAHDWLAEALDLSQRLLR